MKIIDPHLHLFALSQGQYHWLKPDNPPYWPDKHLIQKDFNESDLQLTDGLLLSGFVHIEAGYNNQQPEAELAWLTSSVNMPFKAIACIDLLLPSEQFQQVIKKLQTHQNLTGVRHILDEQAVKILSSQNTLENLNYIARQGLVFECQLAFSDRSAITKLSSILQQCPALICIINHAGFPPSHISDDWKVWQGALQYLATYSNLAIKCSGWEMSNRNYDSEHVQAVINESVKQLGTERVMLASNFPLTLFSIGYQEYWQKMISILEGSSLNIHAAKLCYENATNWYKLKL